MARTLRTGWYELKESEKESWILTEGKIHITRVFYGPWEDRVDFIHEELFASPLSGGSYTFGKEHPIIPTAFVMNVSVEGFGKTKKEGDFVDNPIQEDFIRHDWAKVTAVYETLDYPGGDNPTNNPELQEDGVYWIEEEFSSTLETKEISANEVDIATDENVVEERSIGADDNELFVPKKDHVDFRIYVTITQYTLKIPLFVYDKDFDPEDFHWFQKWLAISGYVNKHELKTISGIPIEPYTMRFDGFNMTPKRDLTFNLPKNIQIWGGSLSFSIISGGWISVLGEDKKLKVNWLKEPEVKTDETTGKKSLVWVVTDPPLHIVTPVAWPGKASTSPFLPLPHRTRLFPLGMFRFIDEPEPEDT